MANTLSELGEWKDVQCYPMYKISSTGAVMNKRTLKILKHYLPKETNVPSVTLYRCKVGEVLTVQELLDEHFPGAKLAEAQYAKKYKTCTKKSDDSDDFLDDDVLVPADKFDPIRHTMLAKCYWKEIPKDD